MTNRPARLTDGDSMSPHARPAVILALDGRPAHPATNPWESLARGEGMLVSWSDGPAPAERSWDAPLRASSALGRQMADIATRTGSSVVREGRTHRLELPAGFGVDEMRNPGTSGRALPNFVADGAAENARTQVLFATLAAALATGDAPAAPKVVEAELRPDGAVQLLRPAP